MTIKTSFNQSSILSTTDLQSTLTAFDQNLSHCQHKVWTQSNRDRVEKVRENWIVTVSIPFGRPATATLRRRVCAGCMGDEVELKHLTDPLYLHNHYLPTP